MCAMCVCAEIEVEQWYKNDEVIRYIIIHVHETEHRPSSKSL